MSPSVVGVPPLLLLTLSLILLLSAAPAQVTSSKCHPEDKKVLLAIKKFWNDPYLIIGWTSSTGCCDWAGITCDENTTRVTGLALFANTNLTGTIPPPVADLPFLRSLDLRKLPNLTGPIIPQLTKLAPTLTFLRMDWNGLSGPVPSFLTKLTKLTYLNLSFNKFTGAVPPELATMPLLAYLRLDRNQLTGPIPASYGGFQTDLYGLFLSHNGLTGPVPSSLGKLNFTFLDLSRNNLTGDASFLFGASKNGFSIDLSRNEFEFDLGKVVFPKGMGSLDLNHNAIYGEIPASIAEVFLQSFNVSYNRLCGKIPTGGNMDRFDASSYLHNHCLCGTPLPPCK